MTSWTRTARIARVFAKFIVEFACGGLNHSKNVDTRRIVCPTRDASPNIPTPPPLELENAKDGHVSTGQLTFGDSSADMLIGCCFATTKSDLHNS